MLTYGTGTIAIRDENGQTTTQTWQAFGDPDDRRLTSLTDANNQAWFYSYNALGKLTGVGEPGGVSRAWSYDGRNLLASETHPESGTTSYGYDAVGNLLSKTDANGTGFSFSYDGNNRLTRVVAGGRETTITYEPGSDNRQTAYGPLVSSTFVYDDAGRMKHRSDALDGRRIAADFSYDGNSNLTGITYTSGRHVRQDYDSENRLVHVVDETTGSDYAANFSYHPSGSVTSYQSGNGVVHSMTYDASRYWIRRIDAGDLHLAYDNYDGVGNVHSIGDSRSGMGQSFGYDALDRLTSATGPYGSLAYTYDALGNRTDAGNVYQNQRMVAQNGLSFGYDSNGNLQTGPNTSLSYTPDNLLEVATIAGVATNYIYDIDTWRIRKASSASVSYF
ncbi:MAG TPA: hypothetical protein VKT80_16125, partial [Chloroflexota bacterium]|nr:hypothetical protein [Chloroflexota bacterium]